MMIDLHSHILPDIDDGSKNVEESLQMLQALVSQGVDTVVATPHFYPSMYSPQVFLRKRQEAWDLLRSQLHEGCPRVLLGAEVLYFEGISQVEEVRDLRIQGTELLLLEMPMTQWNERLIHNVVQMNFWPDTTIVLAHIERYLSMQEKRAFDYLQDNGVLMQVNADFFLHWKTKRRALRMLEKREIDFVGSDCHNMTTRPPRLSEAVEVISSKLGSVALLQFLEEEYLFFPDWGRN